MKRPCSILLFAICALSVQAQGIETDYGRQQREATIARIEAMFDFDMLSATVRTLVSEKKEIDGIPIGDAKLGERWSSWDRQFRSGDWWFGYDGGKECLFTIYFMKASHALDSEGDTALTFVFEIETVSTSEGPSAKTRVVALRYKSVTVSSDHIWMSARTEANKPVDTTPLDAPRSREDFFISHVLLGVYHG